MSGENVCDDFTVITKGERHEVLLHWPPCPLADFSAVLMVSAGHLSPGGIGSRSADVMGVSWGTAILLAGEAGRREEGGCGSDMFHHFKITCALLECWTCLLCGVVRGMDECPSPLEEGFILWDMVIYVNPLDHTVDGLLQLRLGLRCGWSCAVLSLSFSLETASGNGKSGAQKSWLCMKSNRGLAEISILLSHT